MKLGYRTTLAMLLVVGLAACSDDNGTTPQESDPVLAKQSGDAQTGGVDTALPDPLVVAVTRDGSPLSGQTVTWTVAAGGGSVDPASATTGANGQASTTWTLGPAAGGNAVTAAVSGATGSPQTFTATGEDAGPAPMAADVDVGDNFFDPTSARISAGGTVTWNWVGAVAHNVTFAAGSNSATQAAGTFSRTFASAGSYDYSCTIHGAAMSGTVVVE